MNVVAVVPARYASVRLPKKPLQMLKGKSLIQRVYEAVLSTQLFDRVIVATDHPEIYSHCMTFGAQVKMTSPTHASGTDRMNEVVSDLTTDLAINIQGDEPFITREPLKLLIDAFFDESVVCASLMHPFADIADVQNPNNVKVIVDSRSDAIYFSRSVIPYDRDYTQNITYFKHIGVYAYRPETLKQFVALPKGRYEEIERLEQLRLIENGINIKMVLTDYYGIGIDTPEDLILAEKMLS